ncbi:MAG: cytochrome c [Methyloversatilis sp.]|jgi:mono/diheme cytochrome c family protein|nr:cytochrome c [Methyloversatilis sp.]
MTYPLTRAAARYAIALTLTLGAAQAPAFGPGGPGGGSAPAASDASAGEELFGRNCQQCHNSRGKGGKGPQLVKGAWGPGGANSDDYMFKIISEGRPNTQMGGFGPALKPEEIRQIIAFLREEAKRVQVADRKAASEDDGQWF